MQNLSVVDGGFYFVNLSLKKSRFFNNIKLEPTGMLVRGRRKPSLSGAKCIVNLMFRCLFRIVIVPDFGRGAVCYRTGLCPKTAGIVDKLIFLTPRPPNSVWWMFFYSQKRGNNEKNHFYDNRVWYLL